ncbi:MAG: tRNA pseudouridine(38-40) synthase TruA [Candidatus Atribacteria bacterium]|nr:tRNA pseudouridine(38-40) synthase TruA [Candidatus Atribacteria bacterium]
MNSPSQKNIKLIISYDGTHYFGWQKQKGQQTIQGTIEDHIQRLTGEAGVKLIGSGRTDAGVHAVSQVANFTTESTIPVDRWAMILNNQLPGDIRVRYARQVNPDFHARYDAKSRVYRYCILNKAIHEEPFSCRNIFLRNYCYFFDQPLDMNRIKDTANYLIGFHDFSALSCINRKRGQSIENNWRNIKSIIVKRKDWFIIFTIEADSFLYKMVRMIIGTLIDFSMTKQNPGDIRKILENKNNQQSGKVIPPQGLYLMRVKYKTID